MLISLTVGKVDAGVAVLLTQDKRLIEFPSILLPPNISSGSIVDITVARNLDSETKSQRAFAALQDSILSSFGAAEPQAPVLRVRNATQTSVVLEWDPIDLATANILLLSLYRNGQKAGNIPRPMVMQSTKISGLAVDTEYTFHLVLRTTAGTFSSEKVAIKTHKMTDLSGITVTPGFLPAQLRESLTRAVERIGAKIAETVRIDTTHFVTIEGRGIAWEKAVEMNIPVVRPEWVEGCEQGGRIVGVRAYYLDADPRQRPVSQIALQAPSEASPEPKQSPLPTPSVDASGPTTASSIRSSVSPHSGHPHERDQDKEIGQAGRDDVGRESESERNSDAETSKRHDVAHRPALTARDSKKDLSEEAEGTKTPGGASFQDIAL